MAIALVIAGIACGFYGLTIMLVGSGSWFFAFWFVLSALFFAGGWATHSGAWAALPPVGRHAIGIVCVVLVVCLAATLALIARHLDDRGEPGLDYLVVLGAQVRSTGPSVALRSRLDAAYDYLVANEDTRCIVTGAQGPNEPVTEADAMAAYLIERGIDPERIIIEDQATNTAENIRYSLAFLDAAHDRVGIVTNDYHLCRSLAIARKQGIVNVCGIAAGATPWYLPNNMIREAFGMAKDFAKGNL